MSTDAKLIKRYVVLGLARSGTTAVHFALKGHPNIAALNDEVRVSFFTEGISTFTQRDDNVLEKKVGSYSLFDAVAGVFSDENTRALGLKCVPESVESAEALVQSLVKFYAGLSIVLVIRNDFTAQYGSMLRAKLTGEWHSWRKTGKQKNQRVRISKGDFKKYIIRTSGKLSALRQLKKTHEVLEFNFEEQLLYSKNPDFSPLFRFLDIPDLSVTWLDSKKVAPPPEDYIVNYEKMNQFCTEILQSEAVS